MFERVYEWITGSRPPEEPASQAIQQVRDRRAKERDLEIPDPFGPEDFSIPTDDYDDIDAEEVDRDPGRIEAAFEYVADADYPEIFAVEDIQRDNLEFWRTDATGRQWFRRRKEGSE